MAKKNADKYDKYLELSSQRAKSFQKIESSIVEVGSKLNEAGASHREESVKDSDIDIANKWMKIKSGNARHKGYKEGYAEACAQMMPLLQSIIEVINVEAQELRELNNEILKAKVEEDDKPPKGKIEVENKDLRAADPSPPLA
jgi:hypothetical protein